MSSSIANGRLDVDVLIVGAGPTGLMLANQLGRRGTRVMIVDRHAGPAQQTRALGVQARSLEIYAHLGIAERAIALGKIGTGADLWSEGRHIGRVDLGNAGGSVTPYPYILVLGQDDNERLMGEKLRDWNLGVQWSTELTALTQDAAGATATLRGADGATRTLRAGWVAGCDGARSAVREFSGIGFPGAPYQHVFFVADVRMTGTMVPDEVNVYLWKDGFHLFFPMRGRDHWRIVGIVPRPLRGRDDLGFEAVVPSIRGEAGAALEFQGCSWFSTYRIHHRHAARFRNGRCFLLGDAAHVHSPVGAQGMNTGLQDAYNLGWKLALVAGGRADARLLDSYEAERLPVAQRLLATTDRMFKLIVSDNRLAGLLRTKVAARIAAFAMRRPRIQQLAFRTVTQTGIHYRGSVLSESLAKTAHDSPRAGDRFPWLNLRFEGEPAPCDSLQRLDDVRFHLLLAGQPAPDSLPDAGGLLGVHVIADDAPNRAELARVGSAGPAFWLIRPDGHVGLCGARCDTASVRTWLEDRVAMRAR